MKDKGLSPKLAIDEHCRYWCQNHNQGKALCTAPNCKLRGKGTSLQKIKNWCKECALDYKPYQCDGEILNTEYTRIWRCPLHKFRMGRNPRRKGIGRKGGNPNIKNIQSHGTSKSMELTEVNHGKG